MKSQAEFKQFYQRELLPLLENLNVERIQIQNKYSFKKYGRNLLIFFVFAVVFALTFGKEKSFPDYIVPLIFLSIMLYAVAAPIYIFIKRNLAFDTVSNTPDKKDQLVQTFLSYVDSSLNFQPNNQLSQEDFEFKTVYCMKSNLLSCITKNLVNGNFNNRPIKMAYAHTVYRLPNKETSDKCHAHITYATIKLKKSAETNFYLNTPELFASAQNKLRQAQHSFQEKINNLMSNFTGRNGFMPNNIPEGFILFESGIQDFDDRFVVIGNENTNFETFFTKEFCTTFIDLVEKYGFNIGIGIKDQHLYIAINNCSLFEFGVYDNLISHDERDSLLNHYMRFQFIDELTNLID